MSEVVKAYRLKVKEIEERAKMLAEGQFGRSPFDTAGLGPRIVAAIRPELKNALNEGATFGKYVKKQAGK